MNVADSENGESLKVVPLEGAGSAGLSILSALSGQIRKSINATAHQSSDIKSSEIGPWSAARVLAQRAALLSIIQSHLRPSIAQIMSKSTTRRQ